MNKRMKTIANGSLLVLFILTFAINQGFSQNRKDAKELIKKMEKAVGDWDQLYAKNDVEFTYEYLYPDQNIMDLSVERYVFEGEKSWAKYSVHKINVLKESTGDAIQYYDGKNAFISDNGKELTDPASKGGAQFLRKANYFWFVMMYKLSDPGTVHKFEGQETINGINYDKVSVSYESEVTDTLS